MNRHAIASIVTWAVGSFALVLAVGLPASLNADGPAPTTKPTIATPTLKANGVQLQLTQDAAGTLTLTGTNTGSKSVTTTYTVNGMDSTPRAAISRTDVPAPVFSQTGTITLAPGQTNTATVTLTPKPSNPGAGNVSNPTGNVTVYLVSGGSGIMALSNVTLSPAARPATQPSAN